jgi:DNA primase
VGPGVQGPPGSGPGPPRLPDVAGRIRREDVDAVRERTRIEEVVGEHVTLKGAGAGSLKGLCPFHDERSPSFHVRPGVGLYHCFGCGEGGDVFSFLQKVDAITFVEAVELLAGRAGVQLRYEDGGSGRPAADVGRRQRLLDAHRLAADFYAEQLSSPGAAAGRRFLSERGFDRAAAETFGVGFAPTGWGALTDHLRGRGFTSDELVTGGLAAQGARGPYDRFRGRLVWPIRDTTGATIGFGARRLSEDDSGPKYLNTSETPLYRKSSVLYGLDLAKREVARRKQVVVVEGYTDVMACHLAGVPTAVATCGTAFGAEHVAVVRRLLGDDDVRSGEVVFTFDGDEAGQKAALRAFEEDQRFVAQTFVAVEPDGLDPCDLRQAKGDEAVRALVAARRPLFEFAIRSRLASIDLDTAEGRVRALRAAAPLVAGIKDPSLRPEYARQLAGWLGMDVEPVLRAVGAEGRPGARDRDGARGQRGGGQHGGGQHGGGQHGGAGMPGGAHDPVVRAERQLLALVLQTPSAVPPAFDALGEDAFAVPAHRAVHDVVRAAGGIAGAGPGWAERLRESATDELRPLVGQLAVVPLPGDGGEALARMATDLLRGVQDRDLLRQEADLRGRAQRLEGAGDTAGAAAAFAELVAVTTRRKQLQEQRSA